MATVDTRGDVSGRRSAKFSERRIELAEAALVTLAQLGYARTSLREIADNTEFSHGVLHYYFRDKVDLITCGVRLYKARCITRYDAIVAADGDYGAVREAFIAALAATLLDDAHMHRLWYDLRSQALYEPDLRSDVTTIDRALQGMIWRVVCRLAIAAGRAPRVSPALAYAMIDGVFQHGLLAHSAGDAAAAGVMAEQTRLVLDGMFMV